MDIRLALSPNTFLDDTYRVLRVVGSGGFGITYLADDISLGTQVAIKEYYPFDFADRDATMSVRPKSDRHQRTFQWGRTNFLREARTLARFEHPSVVRVTRVFEANSTAYMVMRFEQGQSLEDWLKGLGRPPSQKELDGIVAPLLDALQMMHAANFLHRDIAPDNIIVRPDGSPVLLDFGAARRAIAEMSHSITGIVKPGYSPHEQYSSENRLQGPWSDLYALGGTLYRSVTGSPPEESTLRIDDDRMPSAVRAAKGSYRTDFLKAIDECLKLKSSERPQSVAHLRSKLLGKDFHSSPTNNAAKVSSKPSQPPRYRSSPQLRRPSRRWPPIAAGIVALLGGMYGGYEFLRWQPDGNAQIRRKANPDLSKEKIEAETFDKRQAEEQQREAESAAERARQQAEAKRLAEAAVAQRRAEEEERTRRKEEERIAGERRTAEESARREAEARQHQEERIAADEAARRKAKNSQRVAKVEEAPLVRESNGTLSADERATLIKRVQDVLRVRNCYDGEINGRHSETQKALDRFVDVAREKGNVRPVRIELAKATASDFDTWLRDADDTKSSCPRPPPEKPTAHERDKPVAGVRERDPESTRRVTPRQYPTYPSYQGGTGGGSTAPIQGVR